MTINSRSIIHQARLVTGIFACFCLVLAAACSAPEEKTFLVRMNTEMGPIDLALYPERAPATVANFMRYVDEGLYEGASFYRTTTPENDGQITVIQGGLWAPWKESADEEFEAPLPPIAHETTEATGITHEGGVISMARDEPGSASSEIFITIGDNHSLDFGGARNPDGQGFAAFGIVFAGIEVVNAINAAPTKKGEGFQGQLIAEPVKIISLERLQ